MRFVPVVFALPILAHTLYFLPSKFRFAKGEMLVFSLHNGDSFPASEESVAPARLQDARLIAPSGKATPIADFRTLGRATHGSVKVDESGTHWLAVRTRHNHLTLTPPKFEEYLKGEGLEHAIDWRNRNGEAGKPGRERYSKYAKSLLIADSPSDAWSKALGLTLEFVLEADPSSVEIGGKLPVRVLFRGKPAEGLRVERAWAVKDKHAVEIVGRTGGDGRIQVPIDRSARWRLHTVAIERLRDDPQADWESFWATVTFER